MNTVRRLAALLLVAASLAAGAAAPGFMRIAPATDDKPPTLQVALVRYTGEHRGRPVTVDLVGALHVGDETYYADLNRRFDAYDAVLYELIADADVRPSGNGGHDSMVSGAQVLMQGVLDLAYQLDEIDYRRDNFVHADFSPDELSADMDARGESMYSYFWRLFFEASRQTGKDPFGVKQLRRMALVAASDTHNTARLALAQEFVAQASAGEFLAGPNGSALIEGRNARALEVLSRQLDAGDSRLAIFYGAGHMADFDRRLRGDFGLARGRIEWLDAWNLE